MTDNEIIFMKSALDATGGKDGNFDFDCPLCGGYSIGCLKHNFDLIVASCSKCFTFVREKVYYEKGA